jgi:uncharacterized protein YkwD
MVVLTFSWVHAGCAVPASGTRTSGGLAPHIEVPPDADAYTTETSSGGVRGGKAADDAEALLLEKLAARGDAADSDGALANAASAVLRAAYAQEQVTREAAVDVAQRFGFAGMFWGFAVVGVDRLNAELTSLLAQIPKNMQINRYGITATGQHVAVMIGVVEAELDDFPRSAAPGGSLRLKGSVSERYERASVFATSPDGNVREFPMKDRDVDTAIEFSKAGLYKLEVMGYGATGPNVLVNVPIQVGAPVARADTAGESVDPNLTAEAAEAGLLTLLNQERKQRGLAAVAPDAELRSVALAHSTDMTEHHFVGHVSPTTGTPEDRMKKAKLRLSKMGECVALEVTPAGAHRGLMDSPAHRAAMIDASFTHVGIGVSFDERPHGPRKLVATLLFGRRPAPDDARMDAAAVTDALQELRKARKLPAVRIDHVLWQAAAAGGKSLASGAAKTPEQALSAAGRELQNQVNRTRQSRVSCQTYFELIDRAQLAEVPILMRPDVVNVGIGTAPLEDAAGPKLGVVVMAAGAGPQAIECNNP